MTSAPDTMVRVTSRGRVSEHHPDAWPWIEAGIAASKLGDLWGTVAAFRQACAIDPGDDAIPTDIIMTLDQLLDDPDVLMAERRRFDDRFCLPFTVAAAPHTNDPDPDRVLRVGYLSADFCDHSAALGYVGILAHHDPTKVKSYFYLTGTVQDKETRKFKKMASVWRPVYKETAEKLAEIIRADGIDVLVDLTGYSLGNRIRTLAYKPAPIQITAWGSALGTGLTCMDYLVADDVTIPPSHEPLYREQIIRMPCMIGHFPTGTPPEIGPAPYLRNGYVTFGYLGRPLKISQETLLAWGKILHSVPDARLILKSDAYVNEQVINRIVTPLFAHGIAPERIIVAAGSSWQEHVAMYQEVDVALDVWPENGGATTFESLLMGVPVVTRLGRLAHGRLGASILSRLGGEDVAWTTDEYVRDAVSMAQDDDAYLQDRQHRRDKLLASVMCDGPAMARAWEDQLREVWKGWCQQHG